MEIIWHGDTCFTVKDKERTVVLNPHREAGKLNADIVLSSLGEENTATVDGATRTFNMPGEYEMKAVPILGIAATTGEEDAEATEIFLFEMDKIKVCHLGDLGQKLTSEQVKQIGDVDILLINASEGSHLTPKLAQDIIEAIDPRVVIPMGAGDVTGLLKELGATEVKIESKFSFSSGNKLPDDSRKIVRLKKA